MNSRSLKIEELNEHKEFIFLDTAKKNNSQKISYFFSEPLRHIVAFSPQELELALKLIDDDVEKGLFIAGYISYDAGLFWQDINASLSKKEQPILWMGVYKQPRKINKVISSRNFSPYLKIDTNVSKTAYLKNIQKIKKEIKKGNTYQVNYTIDKKIQAGCSDEHLYMFLRKQQKTPYCAFIKNRYGKFLCFSPELFFEKKKDRIISKPMKGTIHRSRSITEDKKLKRFLKNNEKMRSENLMIVDLLRNDIGRIARTGSVKVPSMFDVETHDTLYQMTSSIQGNLKKGYGYKEIFKALFPCGSVTGAPKKKTMEIIQKLEKGNRGIYCGAIGYISPEKAMFNVPIRTLQKKTKEKKWLYRVGGGIVWDSVGEDEWEETITKTEFLKKNRLSDFSIVETMLFVDKKIKNENKHMQRLQRSAEFFDFKFSRKDWKEKASKLKKGANTTKASVLRVLLNAKGELIMNKRALHKGDNIYNVKVSKIRLDKQNILLKHKLTYRPWYDKAMAKIVKGVLYDEIFLNKEGEVCEGARSNVFIEKKGKIYTPSLSCGLLPGILREQMIVSGQCKEKILKVDDLKCADAVYCGNDVRGLVKVNIVL